MVTAKKYLETYFNVIHERNILLMNKIGQKFQLDDKMLKGTPTDAQIAEVLALIGTSEQPIRGKIDQQPIRRLLWQMNKSAAFFAAKKDEIESKAAAEKTKLPPKLAKSIDNFMKKVSEWVPKFEGYTINLSEIYAQEASALSAKDLATYQRLSEQEKKVLTEFQNTRHAIIKTLYNELGLIINGFVMLEETGFAAISMTLMMLGLSAALVSQFVADVPTATGIVAGIATIGAAAGLGLVRLFKSAAAV